LEKYGIAGTTLNWIKSFLENRKQRVVLGECVSDWVDVLSGVPQGSVLGPILFIIYINDILDNLKTNVELFADDTKLITEFGPSSPNNFMQDDLDTIARWMDEWLLKINPNKSCIVHFGKNNPREAYHINSGGSQTSITSNKLERSLGIHLHESLKWRSHINQISKKVNTPMAWIKKAFC
jgi:hypothetical protein